MMTRFVNIIKNIFVPKFLCDFDEYLLCNYPVVWRTKAIFVLFYCLVGALLLFLAGIFYPFDTYQWSTESIIPLEMSFGNIDNYSFLFLLVIMIISITFWAALQAQIGFSFTKSKDTILTLLLYSICFWLMFSITLPAFGLGAIASKAYLGVSEIDKIKLGGIDFYSDSLVRHVKKSVVIAPLRSNSKIQYQDINFMSIKHARMYLSQGLFYVYIKEILHYLSLFALLLHLLILSLSDDANNPLSLITKLIPLSLILIFAVSGYLFVSVFNISTSFSYFWPSCLCCILMVVAIKNKKQFINFDIIVFGLAFFIGIALFAKIVFKEFYKPSDLALYSINFLGILGAVLTTYVRTLPKS